MDFSSSSDLECSVVHNIIFNLASSQLFVELAGEQLFVELAGEQFSFYK